MSTVPTPRIRVFAGPNGSGKSTLLNRLSDSNIPLYSVVNPDEIEKRLNSEEGLRLLDYGLTSTKSDFLWLRERHHLRGIRQGCGQRHSFRGHDDVLTPHTQDILQCGSGCVVHQDQAH